MAHRRSYTAAQVREIILNDSDSDREASDDDGVESSDEFESDNAGNNSDPSLVQSSGTVGL